MESVAMDMEACAACGLLAWTGVALKIMQLFHCVNIEDQYWLAADMRLVCYDGKWFGYAVYGAVCGVLYIVGFPLAVLVLLYRRRRELFGSPDDALVASTRARFGFLYEAYGPTAWWWEVEELVRKLLLSAVVVLIESGSPLQVRVRA